MTELSELVTAYLRERDEAMGPFDEDDTERQQSARDIVALFRARLDVEELAGLAAQQFVAFANEVEGASGPERVGAVETYSTDLAQAILTHVTGERS